MDRYLVESPHTAQDCEQTIKQVAAMGYILHYDWGCKSGVHKGWAVIESDSDTEALMTVPPFVRHNAKATKIDRYSLDDFRDLHKEK